MNADMPILVVPSNGGVASSEVLQDAYAAKIVVYQFPEMIRRRPGMYIGDTGRRGLFRLVVEPIDNSVNEALAGHCKTICVEIRADGSMSVADDGRGIPVEMHPSTNMSMLELLMTQVFTGDRPREHVVVSQGGNHGGHGLKMVNALSEWTAAEVCREGRRFTQKYARGVAIGPLEDQGPTDRTGTTICFRPDPEIFGTTPIDSSMLETRLKELSYFHKGLTIRFIDNTPRTFQSEAGWADMVVSMNERHVGSVLHEVQSVATTRDGVQVEIAFQFSAGYGEHVRCFVNSWRIPLGTHLSGFRSALSRVLLNRGKKRKLFTRGVEKGEDCSSGLAAVVSVNLHHPEYAGATRERLANRNVDEIVDESFAEFLKKYLDGNPEIEAAILRNVKCAAEYRRAEKAAASEARRKKAGSKSTKTPR